MQRPYRNALVEFCNMKITELGSLIIALTLRLLHTSFLWVALSEELHVFYNILCTIKINILESI